MSKIQRLSEEAINQIAAGEVIENPASVVKELVENAIDAEATKITVEVREGGLLMVRVSDDGTGMEKEEALLSIERHATSKIRSASDLFRLSTMGFRGEALAAIAAISKMTLLTATKNEMGTKVEVEAGVISSVKPASRAKGTTIEVKDLFFNVPARKKFQKSSPALLGEIIRLMTTLSLAYPEVHFELFSGKRRLLLAPALGLPFLGSTIERAKSLLGPEFVDESFSVDDSEGQWQLTGLLGAPSQSRPNRLGQYLFINRRAVVCPAIQLAVREAYSTRLDDKRHPLYLLHLSLPSDLIDVNVHPQKREVRLREEKLLGQKVRDAVGSSLAKSKAVLHSFEGAAWTASEPLWLFKEEPKADLTLELPVEEENVVGLFDHYLILEGYQGCDGLLLVDLQGVRFRLIYDELLQKGKEGGLKQVLLLPFTFEATALEAAMILTHLPAVEALGFSLRPIGKHHFMVEALPPFFREGDVKEFITESAHVLQGFIGQSDIEEKRLKSLALVAARFAKNQQTFNREEAVSLFKALKKSSSPWLCPKGMPIMVHVSRDDIKKYFLKPPR